MTIEKKVEKKEKLCKCSVNPTFFGDSIINFARLFDKWNTLEKRPLLMKSKLIITISCEIFWNTNDLLRFFSRGLSQISTSCILTKLMKMPHFFMYQLQVDFQSGKSVKSFWLFFFLEERWPTFIFSIERFDL